MNPGLRVVFFSLVSGPQFRVSKSMSLETLTLMWLIWRIVGLYIHDYSSRFVRFCWRLEKNRLKFASLSRLSRDHGKTVRPFFHCERNWTNEYTWVIYVYWLDQFLLFHSVGNVIIPTDELSLSIYIYMIEGSLEVKLPTIWTDEKQSRAEAERRERFL